MIQILYEIMIQVPNYDSHTAPAAGGGGAAGPNGNGTPLRASNAPPTRDVLASQLTQLSSALQAVHRVSAHPAAAENLPSLPYELIQYVEGGRNPDIYTREFVELVRRQNQLMRGKMHAFSSFRDVLAREMGEALPELRDDVAQVVRGTGGEWPLREEAGQ